MGNATGSKRLHGFRTYRVWGFLNALRDGARSKVSLVLVLFITAVLFGQEGGSPQVLKLEGDVQYTHDPSIAKDGDTWYLFGTANGPVRKGELPIRCSQEADGNDDSEPVGNRAILCDLARRPTLGNPQT
jgi:hypothetical protein